MDIITKRNKPEEPPTAPKRAPFFLTAMAGHQQDTFIGEENDFGAAVANDEDGSSRIGNFAFDDMKSKFMTKMHKCAAENNCMMIYIMLTVVDEIVEDLRSMSPSNIDFEIISLSLMDDYADLRVWFKFFTDSLEKKTNFEMIQALISTFYKV